MGDAADEDRRETLLHEHWDTDRRDRGDSLRTNTRTAVDVVRIAHFVNVPIADRSRIYDWT